MGTLGEFLAKSQQVKGHVRQGRVVTTYSRVGNPAAVKIKPADSHRPKPGTTLESKKPEGIDRTKADETTLSILSMMRQRVADLGKGDFGKKLLDFDQGTTGKHSKQAREIIPTSPDFYPAGDKAQAAVLKDAITRISGADKDLAKAVKGITSKWQKLASGGSSALSLQRAAEEEFGRSPKGWAAYSAGKKATANPEDKKALRAIYETTQGDLAKAGLKPDDYVLLYRGQALPKGAKPDSERSYMQRRDIKDSDLRKTLIDGEPSAMVEVNPLSSFTASFQTASSFASQYDSSGAKLPGGVVAAVVQVKDILSVPTVAMGTWGESEIVVLGGTYEARIMGDA